LHEIQRLGLELKFVDEALNRKRAQKGDETARRKVAGRMNPVTTETRGQGKGLPRQDLLALVAAVGHPVKPGELREILASKGIERNVESIRTALKRLLADGELNRTEGLRYYVPGSNGNGSSSPVEAPLPLGTLDFGASRLTGLDESELTDSDG
jgi:hypothetical protein